MTLTISPRLELPAFSDDSYTEYTHVAVHGMSESRVVVALTVTSGDSLLRCILLDPQGVVIAQTDLPWIGGGLLVSADLDGELPKAHLVWIDETHLFEVSEGYYPYPATGWFAVTRRITVSDTGFTVDHETSIDLVGDEFLGDGYSYLKLIYVPMLDVVVAQGAGYSVSYPLYGLDATTGMILWHVLPGIVGTEWFVSSDRVTTYWLDGGVAYTQSWTVSRIGAVSEIATVDPVGQHYVGHIDPAFTAMSTALGMDDLGSITVLAGSQTPITTVAPIAPNTEGSLEFQGTVSAGDFVLSYGAIDNNDGMGGMTGPGVAELVALSGGVDQVMMPSFETFNTWTSVPTVGMGDSGLGALAMMTSGSSLWPPCALYIWMVEVGDRPNLTGGPLGVDVYFSPR